MNYLFAGGGTAGHINPAIAIATEIKRRDKKAKILFIGTEYGMEKTFIPNAGFKIEFINIRGFQRKISAKNIVLNSKNIARVVVASSKAKKIIESFKPDFVIGTGGYVSGPVLRTAAKLGIKTLIHEQNAYAGMTSKLLSKVVDTVCISFEAARAYFPKAKKIVLTGNPVREGIDKKFANAKRSFGITNKLPVLSCVGGSLGANAINEQMIKIIKSGEDRFNIIWSTGKRNYDEIKKKLGKLPKNVIVKPYIEDMAGLYSASDLILSRSGAIAVAEIALCGLPSILIPSPNVTANHQEYNAKSLGQGTIVLLEKDIEMLPEYIEKTLFNKPRLEKMNQELKKYAMPNACKDIVDLIMG